MIDAKLDESYLPPIKLAAALVRGEPTWNNLSQAAVFIRDASAQVAQLTADVEKWSGLYNRLQDERAADFAKWFKIINFGGLTEYQAECPQVIDDALRQLENWRWTARMGLVVQAMASECAGKPDWAVLDVDGDMLGYGSTPMDAIKAAKKEVEGE